MRKHIRLCGFVDDQLLLTAIVFWIVMLAIAFGTVWLMMLPPLKSILSWILLLIVHLFGFLIGPFFCSNKSTIQRVTITEQGILVKRFGKTIGNIDYRDVKEFGIKWRMDAERFSMSRDITKAYYVYFAKKELSTEERSLIGTIYQGKLDADTIGFYADSRDKMVEPCCIAQKLEPKLHASPQIEPIVKMYFPEFPSVCERFSYDTRKHTDVDCVKWTSDGIQTFKKSDRSLFDRKLFNCYELQSIALLVYLFLLSGVLLLSL